MDIVTEKLERVLRIEINRPQKKNAITAAMYQTMADALTEAERDDGARAVLIHGSSGMFTAGNDLGDFMVNPPADETAPVFQFLAAVSGAGKPLVAAVNGMAVGVGTTDVAPLRPGLTPVRARSFLLPFSHLGLCPEAGSSYLLPAIVGYQRAAEKLLLGEPFGAGEAREMGFVNEVLPDDQVLERAAVRAKKLASLSSDSVVTTKALMKGGQRAVVQDRMREEAGHFRRLLASPEARDAFAAFFSRPKGGSPG